MPAVSPPSARRRAARRHFRVRKKVRGTAERPRLVVTRSLAAHHAQIVDDLKGHTLASASTLDADLRGAEGDKRPRPQGRRAPRRAGQGRGRRRSSSTAVATSTTAGSPRWPTPPAKPDSSSDEELTNAWQQRTARAAGPAVTPRVAAARQPP
jgi:hypothetical protein